jgi:hypothetical protein
MDGRPNELFLLDAEQAVKEIAQFGSGQADIQSQRITSTVEYLETVLQSLGLHQHAVFCLRYAKAFPILDDGQSRRLARDFVNLAQAQFEAIRGGNDAPDDQDALMRLLAKLPDQRVPEQSAESLASGRLFEDAARAIAAVDELAHRIQAGLESPQVAAKVAATFGFSNPSPSKSVNDVLNADEASTYSDPFPKQAIDSQAQGKDETELNLAAGLHQATDDSSQHEGVSYEGPRIDQAFRRALRLTESGPWLTGVGALLESIDDLDHLPLSVLKSHEFSWANGASIRLQADLALAFAQEIRQQRLAGMGDAILVAHTLILAIQLEKPVSTEPFARLAANFGGRLESDLANLRLRFVIPASGRLLRIVPLLVGGQWIAASWAQFLSADEDKNANPLNLRQHAQDLRKLSLVVCLTIGDESDRLIATEMGQITVGVRFDLPNNLRRRERYRGLVLSPAGLIYPVYG